MNKKSRKAIETAVVKSPIRVTQNLHWYSKNEKTAFFRKLENLCMNIYEF